jgi:FkbM family methyltransferase
MSLKSAAGSVFRWSADRLRVLGLQVRAERNSQLNVRGMRLQWGKSDLDALHGTIYTHRVDGQGLRVFVHEADDVIQQHLAKGVWFDGLELATIARHYRGGTFVDVGANVGNHTLYAALVMRASKVIAFEPSPLVARILRYNLLLNALGGTVEVHEAGLSSENGTGAIVRSVPRNLGATAISPQAGGEIRLVRGDELLAGEKVGFIKIDVEGHELAVLEGLRETIARCRPRMHVEVDQANRAHFDRFCSDNRYRVAETVDRAENSNLLILPD